MRNNFFNIKKNNKWNFFILVIFSFYLSTSFLVDIEITL